MTRARRWFLILLPLVLLGVLVVAIRLFGPGRALRTRFPPVEAVAFKRVVLRGGDHRSGREKEMIVHVVNDGPSDVTIAQVMVDEAYWPFEIKPDRTLTHLQSATIRMAYPWVEGEEHQIVLLTSTGLTFSTTVPVAVETPTPSWNYFGIFSILGVYVGVIPVFLGLLWFPAMRNVTTRTLHFLLSVTVGLLVFLAVDAVHEALEVASGLPGAFEGTALVVGGFAGSLLLLQVISHQSRRAAARRGATFERMALAYMIAVGIGLHNLGEGLAIGSAYALGNIALGGLLVIGFAIHNTTEGLAIVAPVAKERVRVAQFVWMGLLAGAPTIAGAWIGGFTYSAVWSVLFLAVGGGAIVQVAYAILRQLARSSETDGILTATNFAGLCAGFLTMYATGLLVAF